MTHRRLQENLNSIGSVSAASESTMVELLNALSGASSAPCRFGGVGQPKAATSCKLNATPFAKRQRGLVLACENGFSASTQCSSIRSSNALQSSLEPERWWHASRIAGRPELSKIPSNTAETRAVRPLCGSPLEELDCDAAEKQSQVQAAYPDQVAQPEKSQAKYRPPWTLLHKVAAYVIAVVIGSILVPSGAHAIAENSIGASSFGLKVAHHLRAFGLPDELVVVIVAMLPILELRGAIPISYWMKLPPINGFVLAVIGNMIPVPFIVLYLERFSNFLASKSKTGQRLITWVFDITRKKAGPIEEFAWLGLLLFVAVPLPGTGAWSGAIAASILGMPFWDAMTANFLGVVLAGLLVNILVTVGTETALIVGAALFAGSFFMWSALRMLQRRTSA